MKKTRHIPMLLYTFGILFLWSCLTLILLFWNLATAKNGTIEAAKIQARAAYENDVIYRQWNAYHGGVYVPITKNIQPNIYLDVPDRDIQTIDGKKLTKVNPAYMNRLTHELSEKKHGIKGHITSLNPIRPGNAPDDWEKKALQLFEKGEPEISSVEIMNGITYLRFMRPFTTEKSCLACHAKQGYKLGDIRGGISVSIPLAQLKTVEQKNIQILYLIYGLLWLSGVVGVLIGMSILNRQVHSQIESEKLHGVIEMAGAVSHELNQPLQVILAASELIAYDLKEKKLCTEELGLLEEAVERMRTITLKLMKITKYKTKKYLSGKIIDIDGASDTKNQYTKIIREKK